MLVDRDHTARGSEPRLQLPDLGHDPLLTPRQDGRRHRARIRDRCADDECERGESSQPRRRNTSQGIPQREKEQRIERHVALRGPGVPEQRERDHRPRVEDEEREHPPAAAGADQGDDHGPDERVDENDLPDAQSDEVENGYRREWIVDHEALEDHPVIAHVDERAGHTEQHARQPVDPLDPVGGRRNPLPQAGDAQETQGGGDGAVDRGRGDGGSRGGRDRHAQAGEAGQEERRREPDSDGESEDHARQARSRSTNLERLGIEQERQRQQSQRQAGDVGGARLRPVEEGVGDDQGDGDECPHRGAAGQPAPQAVHEDDAQQTGHPVDADQRQDDRAARIGGGDGQEWPRQQPAERIPEDVAELPQPPRQDGVGIAEGVAHEVGVRERGRRDVRRQDGDEMPAHESTVVFSEGAVGAGRRA